MFERASRLVTREQSGLAERMRVLNSNPMSSTEVPVNQIRQGSQKAMVILFRRQKSSKIKCSKFKTASFRLTTEVKGSHLRIRVESTSDGPKRIRIERYSMLYIRVRRKGKRITYRLSCLIFPILSSIFEVYERTSFSSGQFFSVLSIFAMIGHKTKSWKTS